MKRIITVLLLSTALLSCEKEELECKCDLMVTIDGNGYYTMTGVPTDCNGNYDRPQNIPYDHIILGIKNCN